MMRRYVLLLPILAGLLTGPAIAQGTWSAATQLCTIADPRIAEASGIAASRRNPGVFYVHNDSGDSARFFAISKTGKTLATITVENATAVDWEDIACAFDSACKPTVYLADTGDNDSVRPEVQIYAVEEPAIPADADNASITVTAKALRFHYPDGAHDAETLMADWKGRALYVVSKERKAIPSSVYRLEPTWDGPVQTAQKVGQITFSDPLPIYPNMATGGDISPDGTRMVVRTYWLAYEWQIPKGKLPEDVLAQPPKAYTITLEQQGEAICYGTDGKTWLTTSEKKPTPVYRYVWKVNAARPSGASAAKSVKGKIKAQGTKAVGTKTQGTKTMRKKQNRG